MMKTKLKYKTLTPKQESELVAEIKMMLHASRDCLRNQGCDTTKVRFDAADGYYGEAFGIARALHVLGYGTYLLANNIPAEKYNLKWWFDQICDEVLQEEGWDGNNQCDYCYEKYLKDSVRDKVR